MKKIIFLLSLIVLAFGVNAQSTSPRFGTTVGSDNTGRVLTYKYQTVTDAVGSVDSTVLNANAWETIVRVVLNDTICFKNPVVTRCDAGDRLTIIASNSSAAVKRIKFSGSNWITAGTASTTASTSGRAVITFIFDGAKWVEKSRVVQ